MVGATVPAAFAAPGSVPAAAAHVYEDGASLQFPDTWTVGQPLHFTGTGFKATDGSPSILAIKINGGPVSGARYLEVKADADGNISGSIPWQENLKAGESVEINVLTGSLNKKDRQRGGVAATVTVVDNSAAPSDSSVPKDTPSETPSPSEKPSSVPSESPSAPAPSASSPVAAPSNHPLNHRLNRPRQPRARPPLRSSPRRPPAKPHRLPLRYRRVLPQKHHQPRVFRTVKRCGTLVWPPSTRVTRTSRRSLTPTMMESAARISLTTRTAPPAWILMAG